jgi:hypothetical protein
MSYQLHGWVGYTPGNPARAKDANQLRYRSSEHRRGTLRVKSVAEMQGHPQRDVHYHRSERQAVLDAYRVVRAQHGAGHAAGPMREPYSKHGRVPYTESEANWVSHGAAPPSASPGPGHHIERWPTRRDLLGGDTPTGRLPPRRHARPRSAPPQRVSLRELSVAERRDLRERPLSVAIAGLERQRLTVSVGTPERPLTERIARVHSPPVESPSPPIFWSVKQSDGTLLNSNDNSI